MEIDSTGSLGGEFVTNLDAEPHRQRPLLIVISGPSGVGKDSVVQNMKARQSDIFFVVTMTDRAPRPEEKDGKDYFFVSTQDFQDLVESGGFIEHAVVYGDLKGVPREQVRQAMESGWDVVMRLDVQGAAHIRAICPGAVLIFLTAESKEAIRERLVRRERKVTEDLERRIQTAQGEMDCVGQFDYVVVNRDGQLEQAVDQVMAIIQAEHCRVQHRRVDL